MDLGNFSSLMRDGRYAVRVLARSPGFTFAASVCLSLGIGVTAVMYTQIQATVLQPLPGVRDPEGLVRAERPVSYAVYEDLRDTSGQFSALAAFLGPVPLVISPDGRNPTRVWAQIVTPDYFEVLGAAPATGRLFGAEDRLPGAGSVAVLSHRLWEARFGGDRTIAGRRIMINGQPATVIGVAASEFAGAAPTTASADVWIPVTAPARLAPELANLRDRGFSSFSIVGRFATGVSMGSAEESLDSLIRRLERIHNDPDQDRKERRVRLLPGGRMFPVRDEDLPRAVGFPFLLVALVLMMACGNVANMLLARSIARQREISVRLSLGAGPGRILRQLMTESLILAALGAIGGVIFAIWLSWLMTSMRPMIPQYVYLPIGIDWRNLASAVVLAAGAAFLSGFFPALRASRTDIYAGLKSRNPAEAGGRRWLTMRNILVFQQVAVSMVLLLLTGFIVVGWQRSANQDIGYEPANLYLLSLDPVRDGYDAARARDFFDKLPEKLRQVPGVLDAALAQTLPLAMTTGEMIMNSKVEFAGSAKSFGATRADRVGEGFFRSIGARIRGGREFTRRDQTEEARVLIVNQTMARRVWPEQPAVGQAVELEGSTWEVVGVVEDLRSAFPLAPAAPAVYRPITPSGFATPSRQGVTALVRVAPGADAGTLLRQAADSIDPNVTVFQVKAVSDEIEQMLYLMRFATFIYGGMGVFGLVLASVGLAGVTAYALARRTPEFGIRMALGATGRNVLGLVLREGAVIIAAGTLVGLAVALAATRALGSFFETFAQTTGTTVSDPVLLMGGPGLLAFIALAACYLPARRATRIDPAAALRSE